MLQSAITTFLICAVIITVSAIVLANCAETIARLTKLGHMLVGSILLAASTSLPELTVDLNAIYLDLPDIAVGGLIGSSLFNLLILAFADFAHHTRGVMFSRVALGHALAGTLSITLTAVVGVSLFVERKLVGYQFVSLGIGTIGLLLVYAFGMRLLYFDQSSINGEEEISADEQANSRKQLYQATIGFILATAAIFFTAPYLAEASGEIAKHSGLGETFIGTTLVALSTSLPELVATITAIRLGAVDMAIGNIFGSNIFNMLLFVPIDLAFAGPLFAEVSQTHILTCFAVIIVTSIVILGQLYRVETRKFFIEPDAVLVIVLVTGSLYLIYMCK